MDVLAEFAAKYKKCWLCGATAEHSWPGLQTHHIVRGVGRQKSRAVRSTLIRACPQCHHNRLDGMPVVRQLAIKKMFDPANLDIQEVNRLRNRAPNAITADEVEQDRLLLEAAATFNGGYPYPRIKT